MWLNTAKYPGYSIHYIWVIKGKRIMKQGGGGQKLTPPLRLGLNFEDPYNTF